MHQIPTLKRFPYCLAAVFAESLKARCQVENEDVVGAALTGDAPTTAEWSTILLPTKVCLISYGLLDFVFFTVSAECCTTCWGICRHSDDFIANNESTVNLVPLVCLKPFFLFGFRRKCGLASFAVVRSTIAVHGSGTSRWCTWASETMCVLSASRLSPGWSTYVHIWAQNMHTT